MRVTLSQWSENGSMSNRVGGGHVLLHAKECIPTRTGTGLDSPTGVTILRYADTGYQKGRRKRGCEL